MSNIVISEAIAAAPGTVAGGWSHNEVVAAAQGLYPVMTADTEYAEVSWLAASGDKRYQFLVQTAMQTARAALSGIKRAALIEEGYKKAHADIAHG